MNWVIMAWPMVIGACLTLALIYLRIAIGEVRRVPHLLFCVSALAVAVVSALEFAILQTNDLARCQALLRWSAAPIAIMVAAANGFVWSFFGTGRAWLALAGTGVVVTSELANIFSDVPAVRNAVALRQVATFGGVPVTVPQVVEGPWSTLEFVGVIVGAIFVFDASRTLWNRGGKRRALVVGGSIIFFFLVSRGHASLVEKGLIQTPYFVSFTFLGVLAAMAHELADDVFRAAKLSRDLHESERRMDLAAEAAKLGFWTWNIARDEIWANETALYLFEIPPSEKVTLSRFIGTLHPDDRESVSNAIKRALAGEMEYEKEYRVMLTGGGERWIAARGRVELGTGGKPILIRGVLLDITARKQSEIELQQVLGQLAHAGRVSMMGQLASALAHELNQPLGAILRNAEAAELFMCQAEPNLDEVRAIIGDIRKDDQRAGEVIDRLRALLKRRDIEAQPVVVAQLLDEVLALTRADAAARGVKLLVTRDSNQLVARGDRVHLQQVLINLIINGMDALADTELSDRRVVVAARRDDAGFVEIAVTDTGPGIAPEKLHHVFDPFFTTKPHGMGMGLPISRTIVEALGGKITVENEAGGGAKFRFTLHEHVGGGV